MPTGSPKTISPVLYFIRKQIPSIKQVIGWCCFPYSVDHLNAFRTFDYLLTCTPGFVQDFTSSGIKSYLLYHAFEASLSEIIAQDNTFPEVDFLFIGSLLSSAGYHNARKEIIESLLRTGVSLHVHTKINKANLPYLLLKQGAYSAAIALKAIGLQRLLKVIPGLNKALLFKGFPQTATYSTELLKVVRPPLYGLDMFKALARSKVGFNIHIDVAGKYAGNVRLFEVTGVGSCLITDWKDNLHELFELDKEIMTYSSPEECIDKVKWLINNPRERNMISQAGMKRTLRDHTYARRAEQLHDIICKNFS